MRYYCLGIIPIFLGFVSCATAPDRRETRGVFVPVMETGSAVIESSVTVAAVGDILMHGAVKKSALMANEKDDDGQSINYAGYEDLFEDIVPEIRAADIAFANLETPIAPESGKKGRPFVFNAPSEVLGALKGAGFDVLSVANNHSYDQGREGMVETLDEIEKAGIYYIGAGRNRTSAKAPLYLESNGINVAFLGYTALFNDDLNVDDPDALYVNFLSTPSAGRSIQKARELADFVVVSIHWGLEYKGSPTKSMVRKAHDLFEAGADVIIGHHPHVLQKIEVYKAKDGRHCAIIYSLGNFISNQSRFYAHNVSPDMMGDTRDGAVFYFTIERRNYGAGVVRPELSQVFFVPVWTENHRLSRRGDLDNPYIRVISIDRTIKKVESQIKEILGKAEDPNNLVGPFREEYLEANQFLETLKKRQWVIKQRLGDDYSVSPFKTFPTKARPFPNRLSVEQ